MLIIAEQCPITHFLATRKIAHPPYLNSYGFNCILSIIAVKTV